MNISKWLGGAACMLGICLFGALLEAQSPDVSDAERESHLVRMKQVASEFQLLADPGKPDSAVKLIETPILRYNDQTRLTYDSSLWIWSAGGRPSAVLAVEFYPKRPAGSQWLFEIASLSTERIGARRAKDLSWDAKEPGLAFRVLEGAPEPADKPARRLTQLKELHRRFAAHEVSPVEGRIELRPLSSPLVRYADPKAGILDGAILAFVNGTNPEVLLALEARTRPNASSTWQYALVQLTGAKVVAGLDGKTVWEEGDADPPTFKTNYVNGWMSGPESP